MARFLVAPDSFKGTFDASAVAAAVAAGLRAGGAEAVECPLADGGEGTAAVLLAARGGRWVKAPAHDPLRRPIEVRFALLDGGETAVVEVAAASGLGLLAEDERDPERADTFGTGELIGAAIDAGARRVLVAAGGSATTDGGKGAMEALVVGDGAATAADRSGTAARTARSSDLADRGRLAALAVELHLGAELVVLCDVTTAFEDAARVFAPQKGADADAVERLTERLRRIAGALPRDPRGVPMSGAAGGLSGGLWAGCGAALRGGADAVLDAVGFADRLAGADAVVSGEGAIDSQSFRGKVVGTVAGACGASGVPLHVCVGRDDLKRGPAREGLASIRVTPTLDALEAAGRELAAQSPDACSPIGNKRQPRSSR